MGLMDDIEAAEQARVRGEPQGGRTRRRIGVVMLALGAALVLIASYASSWHVMDFDVISWEGANAAKVQIGLWDTETCPERGDCEAIPRKEVEKFVNELTTSKDAEVTAWLDSRWQVGIALFLAAAAAAVLLGSVLSGQRFKVSRLIAAGAFVVGTVALLLVIRMGWAEPVAFMQHGTATYLALAGTFDVMLGALLIGIGRDDGPIPTAVVVRKR